MLQPSRRIEEFIKDFEELRLVGYLPTPNDVPTIGYGHTGPAVYIGLVWTEAQAGAAFADDLQEFALGVIQALGTAIAQTTQDEFDAMVSLAFNIGLAAFRKSTLLRMHKAGDRMGAADQFLRWNKQKGRVLRGLTRRREAERAIYLGGGEQ